MDVKHVVVDGSNIATEGRTAPSLEQLDEAVRAFLAEYGEDVKLTVVVDATFGHRIDAKEKPAFEAGIVNGELVAPPAGAVGRGDAFILQIADKTGATVFSNDSFQEFHGIYEWLFDEGRLVGGKPVPAVGWVFVLRTPVRGETSRRATRSKRSKKVSSALGPMPVPKNPPPRRRRSGGGDDESTDETESAEATEDASGGGRKKKAAAKKSSRRRSSKKAAAAAESTADGADDSTDTNDKGDGGGRRRRRGSSKPADPINEPAPFLDFVATHPVGSEVDATVDRFSSHGAYAVTDAGAQCYIPLKAMADPPPTPGRDVLTVGEVRTFVVTSFDPSRRGIDVALPGVVVPEPTPEPSATDRHDDGGPDGGDQPAEEAPSMAVKKKAAAKKAPAKKKAAAKKAPAKKAPAKKAPAKKAPAKKAPAKKAPAKKAPAKKAPAKRRHEEGSRQEGAREEGARHQGPRQEGSGQEGPREEGSGQEGAREEGSGQEGAREEGSGQEGTCEEGSGQEGAREEGSGQEDDGQEGRQVAPASRRTSSKLRTGRRPGPQPVASTRRRRVWTGRRCDPPPRRASRR